MAVHRNQSFVEPFQCLKVHKPGCDHQPVFLDRDRSFGRKKTHPGHLLFQVVSVFLTLSILLKIIPPASVSAAAPIVNAKENPTLYPISPANSEVTVDPTITINGGGNTFTSARVSIARNFVSGQDQLVYTTTGGISGSYNAATGILTLTGSGDGTAYQAAFRNVKYKNTSASPNYQSRTIQFTLGNSMYSDETGHYYEWVSASGLAWTTARDRAQNIASYGTAGYPLGLYGMQGYLVTVTSAAENTFVTSKLNGQGWMGATDMDVDQVWRWKTGPEGLMDGGKGLLFFRQAGWLSDTGPNNFPGVGASATQPVGTYYNWSGGEPNNADSANGGENVAHFYTTGLWNDFFNTNPNCVGYVVEYGGMSGDPVLQLFDTVTIEFESNPNKSPVFTEASPVSVEMNINGSPVPFSLTLHATDANAGDTITWSISTPAQHGTAGASGTGTSQPISYTPANGYAGTDTFYVRVTDQNGGFSSIQVNVSISSNLSPAGISLSAQAVDENQPAGTAIGTFSTTDPDTGNTFTYTLVSGDGSSDNAAFAISGSTLQTASVFNYEVKNTFSIRVRSTDQGGKFTEKIFSILINNVNEPPVIISNGGGGEAGVNVSENTTAVTAMTAADADTGTMFTYSIAGGADAGKFSIQSSSGVLAYISAPDFEIPTDANADNIYEVIAQVSDGGLTDTQALSVTVRDVNEAPTNIDLSNTAMNENSAVNSVVGTLSTADPDAGSSFTYTLAAGDGSTDNGSFSISGSSLQAAESFDYEVKSSYSIRVRSTDQGGLWTEMIFTITVHDLNEAPNDISLSDDNEVENSASGSTVGLFSTIDPDVGNTFTYILIPGDGSTDNASFTISGRSLKTAASFDYEAKNSYSIRIRATDQAALFIEKVFIITILDLNEPPSTISLSNQSINENKSVGTVVGLLSTTDPDIGNTFTYSLVAGEGSTDNTSFSVSGGSLQTVANFDYETKNSYSIRIRSTDQGSLFAETAFIITIADVNEAPVILSNGGGETAGISVMENTAAVTTVDAADVDANTELSYSISGGLDSGLFSMNTSTGELSFSTAPDFEIPTDSNSDNVYIVIVQVSDGEFTDQQTLNVTLTDVNETPADIALSSTTTHENEPIGSMIGTLSTSDPDAANTFTYSMAEGEGSTDNGKFSISGTLLQSAESFNFEVKSSYSVRIRSTDQSGSFTEEIFIITITDVNEAPNNVMLDNLSVAENQPVNTVVGGLTSTDPDAANSFTYELAAGEGSADNGSFNINGTSLRTSASFDYETKNSYAIRIRTTDQGGLSNEKAFIITVNDVNETPIDITLDTSAVDENRPANSLVGSFSTLDTDVLQTFTYTLVTGTGSTENSSFALVDGDLYTATTFDYELKNSYSIRVRSTDQDGLYTEKVFTVTINNVNDAPLVHSLIPDQNTNSAAAFSFTFAADTFSDPEGDTLSYTASLVDGSPLPAWLVFTPSMRLFAGTPLDTDAGTLAIKVLADDGKGGQTFDVFNLSVNRTGNLAPVQNYPIFNQTLTSSGSYSFTLIEDTFTDPDSTATLTFDATLTDGNDLPGWLSFNPASHTFSGTPPADMTGSLDIRISVYDQDGGWTSTSFSLSIAAPAENHTPFVQSPLIDRNAAANSAFSYPFPSSTFIDPDDDPLTYTASRETGDPLPAWLSFDGDALTFSGTPANTDVGSFLVRVTAADAYDHSTSTVFRIAVSNTMNTILYKVLSPSGNEITDKYGKFVIPSDVIGLDTHSYLFEITGSDGIDILTGYKSLGKFRNIGLYQGQNQPIEDFASPVKVCYSLEPSQVNDLAAGRLKIGTKSDDQSDWTLLDTTWDETVQMACVSASHFSLFDLFTRIVSESVPATGFAPGVVTDLEPQMEMNTYQSLGTLWLEVPDLGIRQPIVGVYPSVSGWDVSWLGDQIGWLNSTAYPTWAGNSLLTGHVVDSNGLPGIFYNLQQLRYGDQVIVHLDGQKYIYEVRSVNRYADPQDERIFRHEDLPWLTLVTCKGYDEETGAYRWRTVVRAVQVRIEDEK